MFWLYFRTECKSNTITDHYHQLFGHSTLFEVLPSEGTGRLWIPDWEVVCPLCLCSWERPPPLFHSHSQPQPGTGFVLQVSVRWNTKFKSRWNRNSFESKDDESEYLKRCQLDRGGGRAQDVAQWLLQKQNCEFVQKSILRAVNVFHSITDSDSLLESEMFDFFLLQIKR